MNKQVLKFVCILITLPTFGLRNFSRIFIYSSFFYLDVMRIISVYLLIFTVIIVELAAVGADEWNESC